MNGTEPGWQVSDDATLPDFLRMRSAKQPEDIAYVFLRDGEEPEETMSYRELDLAARIRAARLTAMGLTGRNAVLLYPSGLEFVRALLGCMYAGVAGAPAQVPTRAETMRRLRRIADDADTRTVLTTAAIREELLERFAGLPEAEGFVFLATDAPPDRPLDFGPPHPVMPGDLALLQYTSGSTGDPKGVMVTHANFMSNVRETDELWPCRPDDRLVSWLPLFHDMGMLFGIVLPLWAGLPSYLMAPSAFIRRPARWLEALSKFRGTHSAAPSFAYDLCVRAAREGSLPAGLDLSAWRIAGNGAEPVRWHTIRAFSETFAGSGFRARAMCPGYGLAENTLKATGSRQEEEPRVLWLSGPALREGRVTPVEEKDEAAMPIVGCGRPNPGTRLRVVDPQTRTLCPPGAVGELWINGPCVAAGYWGRPVASEGTFRARVAGPTEDTHAYLRTGDLGFLYEGELFVTGRLKDVIVRQGRNYYPQDIELAAESSAPGLHPNCAAAFAVDDGVVERLVIAVEADGRVLRGVGADALRELVRAAIWARQRLQADDIVVVRRGSLPKTSSGKVRRRTCRNHYLDGRLGQLATVTSPSVQSSRA